MHELEHTPGDSTANAPAHSIMKMQLTEHQQHHEQLVNDSSNSSNTDPHDASFTVSFEPEVIKMDIIQDNNAHNHSPSFDSPTKKHKLNEQFTHCPFRVSTNFFLSLCSRLSKSSFLDKGLFNVFNLGFSFFLLFCSYETTQNFLTTIREEEGFIALFVLYTAFAFASFVSPSFCTLVGEKTTIIIGSSGYILFVFSAAIESSALLYVAAAYNGFCAALLWTSQGSLLTLSANYSQQIKKAEKLVTPSTTEVSGKFQPHEKEDSNNNSNISHSFTEEDTEMVEIKLNNDEDLIENEFNTHPNTHDGSKTHSNEQTTQSVPRSVELMGVYSGIFFGIYQMNFIAGNLLAGSLISAGFSNFSIFFILGCLCVVGMISLFTIQSLKLTSPCSNTTEAESSSMNENTSPSISKKIEFVKSQGIEFLKLVKGSVFVLFSKKMLIFSLISIYSGFSASFFYGSLPPIIGKTRIGWVMICFGVMQVLCALISGKLNDFIGRRTSMVMSMVIHAIGIALSFQMVYWGRYSLKNNETEPPTEVYVLFFVTMGVFGGADAFLTNSIYSILGSRNYYKKVSSQSKLRNVKMHEMYPYFNQKHTSEAFSAFRFVQSISTAVGFAFGIVLSIVTIQFLLVLSFVLCIVAFLILDGCIASVDKEKHKSTKRKTNETSGSLHDKESPQGVSAH
nr:unnamed protein product [Naegleria fowleri]